MGDGKPAATRTRTAATARRANRFNTRANTRSFNIERQPIVLEISSTVIRVGYAEQFQPQHLIPIEPHEDANKSESQWYAVLSPWIEQVYDRLMCNPTTRRVVILHKHFVPKAWLSAIQLILWNKGVPAIVCFSSLEMLPTAQGWKRGLVVQVSREEAFCICHSDGHVLEFTYQSVPCGYKDILPDELKISDYWTDTMSQLLLNENNPNSLVSAVLKCLEACPRDIRRYVISNLVFCGDGMVLLPDLGRRVGQRIKDILEGTQSPLELGAAQDDAQLAVVPTKIAALKPLVENLAVTSCAPHRPDWISWVGSSLWAAIWNKYDDDESRIKWTFAPKE